MNISLEQNKPPGAAIKDCSEQKIELSQITDYIYISSNLF